MAAVCPHCHGSGLLPGDAIAKPQVDALALALASACRTMGARLTGDGRVDEATAATLVGRAKKTLSNLRHTSRPIPFVIRGRSVFYALDDLADWLLRSGKHAEF